MSAERKHGESPAPTLSVVVASWRERAQLDAFLDALLEQSMVWEAEVVVTRAGPAAEVEALSARHGHARFIACGAGAKEAELRAVGMRAVDGDIVALTTDGFTPSGDWLGTLVSGYRAPAARVRDDDPTTQQVSGPRFIET